jgi:hypothetical protein
MWSHLEMKSLQIQSHWDEVITSQFSPKWLVSLLKGNLNTETNLNINKMAYEEEGRDRSNVSTHQGTQNIVNKLIKVVRVAWNSVFTALRRRKSYRHHDLRHLSYETIHCFYLSHPACRTLLGHHSKLIWPVCKEILTII